MARLNARGLIARLLVDDDRINVDAWVEIHGPTSGWKAFDYRDNVIRRLAGELPPDQARQARGWARNPASTGHGPVGIDSDGIAIAGNGGRPGAGGQSSSGSLVVEVVDATSEAAREKRMREEARLKRELNELPAWTKTSTVSGQKTALGIQDENRKAKEGDSNRLDGDENEEKQRLKAKAQAEADSTAQYYATLGANEEEEDEDEEEQFEDVLAEKIAPRPDPPTPVLVPQQDQQLAGSKRSADPGEEDASKKARTQLAQEDDDEEAEEEFEEV